MMNYQNINWTAVVGGIAFLAALTWAGTQPQQQAERRANANPQGDRKEKVIEADRQGNRGTKAVEITAKKGQKGEVIEADRQGQRGAKALELTTRKGLPLQRLTAISQEQVDRVPAIPGQGPVISTNPCPDPAAQGIAFTILSRTTSRSGRVRIEGIVRNLGRAVYEAAPGTQTKAQLWQVGSGGARLVAEKSFTVLRPELVHNLNSATVLPSSVVRVQFDRDWDSRSPNLGEFPPLYRLRITHQGSGEGSGSPTGDCNLRNNLKERSGADINTLFRQ
jgi:hypothetical protein